MVDGVNKFSGREYIPAGNEIGNDKAVPGQGDPHAHAELDAKQIATLQQLLGSNGVTRALEDRLLEAHEKFEVANAREAGQQFNGVSRDTVSADIFTFMALFQKMAQEMRNSNRELRTQELQGQISELQNAASEMRTAAQARFAAAVTQSALQLAGGVVQVGMSTAALGSTVKGIQAEKQATNTQNLAKSLKNTPENADLRQELRASAADVKAQGQTLQARGAHLNQSAQGTAQALGGLGGIVSASLNLKADLADAKRSEAETRSKEHEIEVQHANEIMQQMMDVIRDVREKLGSMQQASVETNRGIARNI